MVGPHGMAIGYILHHGFQHHQIGLELCSLASLDLDNADGDDDDSTGNDVTDDVDETTIRTRLQDLCDDLNPVTDYLFVYVTDHGMSNGAICLWDFDGSTFLEADEQYSPAESFQIITEPLPGFQIQIIGRFIQ